jgi:hypothetical protein
MYGAPKPFYRSQPLLRRNVRQIKATIDNQRERGEGAPDAQLPRVQSLTVKAWGWLMADGPVCGSGFLGPVLQDALWEVSFVPRVSRYAQLPIPILLLLQHMAQVRHAWWIFLIKHAGAMLQSRS